MRVEPFELKPWSPRLQSKDCAISRGISKSADDHDRRLSKEVLYQGRATFLERGPDLKFEETSRATY